MIASRSARYCSHRGWLPRGNRSVMLMFGNIVAWKNIHCSVPNHVCSDCKRGCSSISDWSRPSIRRATSLSTRSLDAGDMLLLLTIPNPLGVSIRSRCGMAFAKASYTMTCCVSCLISSSSDDVM